jgi:hypothetical protein
MSRAKLDVISIVGDTLVHALRNVWPAVRVSAIWLIVLVCVGGVLTSSIPFTVTPEGMPELKNPLTGAQAALIVGCALILLVIVSAAAASWHRYVLSAEPPPALPMLDLNAFRYAAYSLLLILLSFLMYLGGSLVLAPLITTSGNQAAILLVVLIMMVIVAQVMGRFSMVLPSAATGQRMTLGVSWALTAGNTWRIFGILFLVQLVTIIPNEIASAMVRSVPALQLPGLILSIVLAAISFVLVIGALSRIFQALVSQPIAEA